MTTTAMRRDNDICYADMGNGKYCGAFREAHGRVLSVGDHEFVESAVLRVADEEPPRRAGAGEHAPTPWHVSNVSFGGAESDGDLVIRSEQGIVAYACTSNEGLVNAENNARHIARCVNSHRILIAALELAQQTINELTWNKKITGKTRERLSRVSELAGEALEKARERR